MKAGTTMTVPLAEVQRQLKAMEQDEQGETV